MPRAHVAGAVAHWVQSTLAPMRTDTFDALFSSIAQHLDLEAADERSRFLASLLVELAGPGTPEAVRALAATAPRQAAHSGGPVIAIWRALVKRNAMTAARAEVLATRLSDALEHPAALAFLAEEAAPWPRAADVLREAVRRRFPDFELRRPRIARETLEALGVPLHTPGVSLRLNGAGEVTVIAALDARLTLEPDEARGRFVDRRATPRQGWAVDELYARGCARGACAGDASAWAQPMSWLVWVAKSAMAVCLAAHRPLARTAVRRAVTIPSAPGSATC